MAHTEHEKRKAIGGALTTAFLAVSLFTGFEAYQSYNSLRFFEDFAANKKHALVEEFSKECQSAMNQSTSEQAVTRCAEDRADIFLRQNTDTATQTGRISAFVALLSGAMMVASWRQYRASGNPPPAPPRG